MSTRKHRQDLLEELRHSVLESAGVTSPATRQAVAAGHAIDPGIDSYLNKVRAASYRVVDGDIGALRNAGRSEEEIFELTVAAGLGTALTSFDAAMQHLEI